MDVHEGCLLGTIERMLREEGPDKAARMVMAITKRPFSHSPSFRYGSQLSLVNADIVDGGKNGLLRGPSSSGRLLRGGKTNRRDLMNFNSNLDWVCLEKMNHRRSLLFHVVVCTFLIANRPLRPVSGKVERERERTDNAENCFRCDFVRNCRLTEHWQLKMTTKIDISMYIYIYVQFNIQPYNHCSDMFDSEAEFFRPIPSFRRKRLGQPPEFSWTGEKLLG